jgi:hypothetical protein
MRGDAIVAASSRASARCWAVPHLSLEAQRTGSFGIGKGGLDGKAVIAWAIVGIPILWGVWVTLRKAAALL